MKRKLIGAVAMMMVAMLSLSVVTYAWFSMNTQVTATGMTVTAKSNASYLLIATADNAADKDDSDTTIAATTATAEVYPAAYNDTAVAVEIGDFSAAVGTWYTASNGNSNDANNDVKNGKAVTLADANYMLTNTFYLSLSEDSEDYDEDIQVTFNQINTVTPAVTTDEAISAVVTIDGNTFDFTTDGASQQFTLSTALKSTTSIEVKVYTYVNGESDNVNSDYINGGHTITGEISLTFDLVATVVPEP